MTGVIIGAGEVGTALHQVLPDVHLRDIEPTGPDRAGVLHIAIRHTPTFIATVSDYQRHYDADLVIVHSTVPVGTCDPNGWVHSPVRGRHPDLVDGLKTFTKHVGGARAPEAAANLDAAGITTVTHPRAADTEAGKLWELVQFGLQVTIQHAIYEWCASHDVDPDVVYRAFAQTYNDGYAALGERRFVRPVLDYTPGPIGGHCVRQNAHLLDHPLAGWLERT